MRVMGESGLRTAHSSKDAPHAFRRRPLTTPQPRTPKYTPLPLNPQTDFQGQGAAPSPIDLRGSDVQHASGAQAVAWGVSGFRIWFWPLCSGNSDSMRVQTTTVSLEALGILNWALRRVLSIERENT